MRILVKLTVPAEKEEGGVPSAGTGDASVAIDGGPHSNLLADMEVSIVIVFKAVVLEQQQWG